jgi:hypothetical protein
MTEVLMPLPYTKTKIRISIPTLVEKGWQEDSQGR